MCFCCFDIKTFGLIFGLLLSALGLILNAIASFRNNVSRKLTTYQDLTKSHRELWKLTLDNPDKYIRIFDKTLDINSTEPTYVEERFVHLIFLHTMSVFYFSKNSHLIEIEKFKFDINDFLSYPIPKKVWEDSKHFFNKSFIKFVDRKDT